MTRTISTVSSEFWRSVHCIRGTGYRLTAGDPPNSDMHAKSVRSEGTGMKGCRRLCSLEWWSSSRFGQRVGRKEVSADAQRQLQTISTPTHPQPAHTTPQPTHTIPTLGSQPSAENTTARISSQREPLGARRRSSLRVLSTSSRST